MGTGTLQDSTFLVNKFADFSHVVQVKKKIKISLNYSWHFSFLTFSEPTTDSPSTTPQPSSLTNQHLLKVQDASIESSQLKKSLSSPDLPSAVKDETKSESETSKSKQRYAMLINSS